MARHTAPLLVSQIDEYIFLCMLWAMPVCDDKIILNSDYYASAIEAEASPLRSFIRGSRKKEENL